METAQLDDYERLARAFSGLNNLNFKERLNCMKPIERWHLESMNAHPVNFNDSLLDKWVRASSKEDIYDKLDCLCGSVHGQQKIPVSYTHLTLPTIYSV